MTETGSSSMHACNNGMHIDVLSSSADSVVQTLCQICMCCAVQMLGKEMSLGKPD